MNTIKNLLRLSTLNSSFSSKVIRCKVTRIDKVLFEPTIERLQTISVERHTLTHHDEPRVQGGGLPLRLRGVRLDQLLRHRDDGL